MSETPYTPIACADYDIYEIAIMQSRRLSLLLAGSSSRINVIPVALKIENGAEYLEYVSDQNAVVNDRHEPQRIRLDKINQAEVIT